MTGGRQGSRATSARAVLAIAAILAVGLGVQVLRKPGAGESRPAGSSTTNIPGPLRPPEAPASRRHWHRAWTYPAGAPLAGAPASLGDGWVVNTGKGRVVALDGSGRELWSRGFTNLTFAGSVAVADGVLVVADATGHVVGLEAVSGRTLWETAIPGVFRRAPLAVRVGDAWRVVALNGENGALRCLNANDGRELWHTEPTNRSDGPPAGDGHRIVYGNCDAAVHVFDAANGSPLGSIPVGAEAQMAGALLLLDGRVYGGTRAGELVCVDAAARALAWHVSVAGGEAFGTPVAARGLVVMGTPEGRVAAFDAGNGAERWKVSVSNAVSGLCAVDDAVFAVAGGRLLGLRLADGARFATLPIGDEVAGPAFNGRVLVVADDGGTVIAVAGE